MSNKKRLWLYVGIFAVLLLVFGFLFSQFRPGIRITVQNVGAKPMHSVVLHVTGGRFALGDIAPGASGTTTIRSTGESHLEIEFADVDGQPKRLNAGGYFESRYRGTIQISIRDGVIENNAQLISGW